MQPGSRRGNGTRMSGINSLIAFAIRVVVRPVYIRRQRHMADPLQQWQHFFGEPKFEKRIVTGEHLGFTATIDQQGRAGLGRFA
ncbi:hypothetical protein D3C85_1743400 [compost metagenome]